MKCTLTNTKPCRCTLNAECKMEREQYAAGKRKARYSLPVVLPFNCGPDDLLDLCWFMLPRDYIDETGDAYWHWYQSTL